MTSARPLPSSVRLAVLTLGAVFALSLGNPVFAQWKWKDKNGQVQYSDLPPPASVREADILQRPATGRAPAFAPNTAQAAAAAQAASAAELAASAASAAPSAPTVDPELEAKRRKAAEGEAAKRRAEEQKANKAREANCKAAQAQLRALNSGIRMARVNPNGEREVLDDKARAEETQRARDAVSGNCD